MITITGATGQFGSTVVDFLIEKGLKPSSISAFARSEEKAQALSEKGVNITIGNYNDYSSMVAAFKGTDKLLFVSSSEMENRDKQQISVVKAAKEAGVAHILYTSVQRKSDSPDSPISFVSHSHIETEKAIKESGMKYTFFLNNLYMEILPWILGEQVFETGVFYPAKDGKIAFALRSDMAEATANVLLSEGHEDKSYSFSNTHSLTFGEVAEHLSSIAAKTINYVSPTVDVYKSTLASGGAPEMVIDMLAGFAVGIELGEFEVEDTDLADLLGREPVSYKDFLTGMYAQK